MHESDNDLTGLRGCLNRSRVAFIRGKDTAQPKPKSYQGISRDRQERSRDGQPEQQVIKESSGTKRERDWEIGCVSKHAREIERGSARVRAVAVENRHLTV